MSVTALPPARGTWEIELAKDNLARLRREGSAAAAAQCEAWLDFHAPGWRRR